MFQNVVRALTVLSYLHGSTWLEAMKYPIGQLLREWISSWLREREGCQASRFLTSSTP